jgi:hypothetical protein
MPNIENLKKHSERSESFTRTPRTLDREQLEYSATKILTYGTIVFTVILGLGSVTYMTIQQLRK